MTGTDYNVALAIFFIPYIIFGESTNREQSRQSSPVQKSPATIS